MNAINLLPWRELAVQQRIKYFLGSIFGIIILIGVGSLINGMVLASKIKKTRYIITQTQQELQHYAPQLTQLQQLKKHNQTLLSQLTLAEQLQLKNKLLPHLLVEVSRLVPEGVYLTQLKYTDQQVILTGNAESNTLANQLLHNLQLAKLTSTVSLKGLEHHPQNEQFIIVLAQHEDTGK
jgi:type IV pilus assembly protein PilN